VLQQYMDHKSSQFSGPFTTVEQALFSMRFGIAAIVIDGEISAATYCDVTRSDLAAIASKIQIESGGDPKEFPRFLNVSVEIRLMDGTVYKGGRELIDLNEFYPNVDTARAKFLRVTASVLPAARAQSICNLVLDQLQDVSDIGEITELLA
jgi:2-methylcitrate dehydratase PrpD